MEEEEGHDRTVLFMDALELDREEEEQGGVPDLGPGMVDREIRKASTAFFFSTTTTPPGDDGSRGVGDTVIVTGLWGCGSFGGDRYVKTLVQWVAASMAQVRLRFVVWTGEGDGVVGFADALRDLVQVRRREGWTVGQAGRREGWTVGQVVRVLKGLRPQDEGARNAFTAVRDALRGSSYEGTAS